MSRGKPRHQSNRRRMYSARQREVRERRERELEHREPWPSETWPSETMTAFEIEESLGFEAPTSWGIRLSRRSAA